jgi:hypothetical protein
MSNATDQASPIEPGKGVTKRPFRFLPQILFVLVIGTAISGSFYWYWPAKHEVKRVFYIVHDIKAAAAQSGYKGLTPAKMVELGIGKQIGSPVWVNPWGGHIEVKPVNDGSRFQLVDSNLPARACSDLAVIDTPYNMGKLKHPTHGAPFAVWINGSLIRAWGGELNKWAISRTCDHPSNIVTLELK